MNYFEQYQQMIRFRGLTEGTAKTYSFYLSMYLDYVAEVLNIDPSDVSWQQMRDFIDWLQQTRGICDRTVNTAIAQLRFFTIYVLHKPWDNCQIPRRKFDEHIPFIPSRQEVSSIINTVDNLQVRVMLILMYSTGMRISEVRNLRYEDVSRASMRIHIRKTKNRHARNVPLSQFALDALSHYWRVYGRPMGLLFRNRYDPDKPVCSNHVKQHIAAAEKKLGWPHRFSNHTFRHAFATHFYEDYGDLLVLKELLGHRSIKSTVIYVTLASTTLQKYASPIESLGVSYV